MLNSKLITDAVVSAWRSIPALVTAMNGDPTRIIPHHFLMGANFSLAEAVYKMKGPSILVAFDGVQGGNFDGATIWKHRVGVYIKMGNSVSITNPAVGYEDLWSLMMNSTVTGTWGNYGNIRQVNLLPDLDVMDTPSIRHSVDENKMDYFQAQLVIPQIGDN